MKVKRMRITEILRRIWLFSANKIKSSEPFSKQPTQLIVELNSSLWHIIVTKFSNMHLRTHPLPLLDKGEKDKKATFFSKLLLKLKLQMCPEKA